MTPTRCSLPLLFACAAVAVFAAHAQGRPQAPPDPTTAILAAHKAADENYARAMLSPFTAVAVQYFQPGHAMVLALGPNGPAFGPSASGPDRVELAFDDGGFSVTPVSGEFPHVATADGSGGVAGLPGTPVTGRRRLAPREVIRLGRHLVEFVTAPGNGNARVFDPESASRRAFKGLEWFAPNPAFRVEARFVANPTPTPVTITTSRGLQREYFRVGRFEFALAGKDLVLTALATIASPKPGDELFVAFRDATTGRETYEVGRYLFIPFKGAGTTHLIDFNLATNPLCNYSPHYNCPIPLRENLLPVAITAGEKKYPVGHD